MRNFVSMYAKTSVLPGLLTALLFIVAACHNPGRGHGHEHEHEEASHVHGASDEISLSEERQRALGIETRTVSLSEAASVIKAGGEIAPSPGDASHIVAPVAGVISFSRGISEGTQLSKGGVVALVSSGGLGGGDVLVKARAAYEAARGEYERDAVMVKENIVSQAHYEQSKAAYEAAKSEYEALGAQGSGDGGVAVKSPVSGYVTALYVQSGQYVQGGQSIAAISGNRTLRLSAEVPERYAGQLRDITDATFTTASGETLSVSALGGRVLGYSRSSRNGYIPVVFEFQNRESVVPGSYVDVYLKGRPSGKVISVPAAAILEEQGSHFVYVRLDEDCFTRREVSPGATDGLSTVIVKGLSDGEEVVVKGAMLIKLASASVIPAGHTHNH